MTGLTKTIGDSRAHGLHLVGLSTARCIYLVNILSSVFYPRNTIESLPEMSSISLRKYEDYNCSRFDDERHLNEWNILNTGWPFGLNGVGFSERNHVRRWMPASCANSQMESSVSLAPLSLFGGISSKEVIYGLRYFLPEMSVSAYETDIVWPHYYCSLTSECVNSCIFSRREECYRIMN